jgi:hypothetical protein
MSKAVNNPSAFQSKLEQIRTGATKKTDLGVKSNQNIVHGKGGKYHVFETEKKFEETGVRRKKRNYVLYESKLGTQKEKNLKKIEEPKPMPKPKPKPVPVARPRMEEKIITQKKRIEYLDNYQYHESKVIRRPDPNRVSIVEHKRLSDIIGGFYEEMTYQKQSMGNMYSQRTTTTARHGPTSNAKKITQKTITSSRTVPAQSRDYRKETAQRGGNKTTTTTTTKTTTIRSKSRPQNDRGTTTTTTKKVVTRSQSSGRRH